MMPPLFSDRFPLPPRVKSFRTPPNTVSAINTEYLRIPRSQTLSLPLARSEGIPYLRPFPATAYRPDQPTPAGASENSPQTDSFGYRPEVLQVGVS
jgi:hypothetical protein